MRSLKNIMRPVSQEISPPGKIVAATKFPRIYGRSGKWSDRISYKLLQLPRKIGRTQWCAQTNRDEIQEPLRTVIKR